MNLAQTIGLRQQDLIDIGGTIKQGIYKKYWGKGSDFLHPFYIDSIGMHFTANELHNLIFEKIKDNKRINIIQKNVEDPEKLDSDFVIVCSGTPEDLNNGEYIIHESIPVNSAYVVQCE
jgi:hypothetical protein